MKITLDLAEFNQIFEQSAQTTFERLGDAMQEQLTDEVRSYPRRTKRKFGRGVTGKDARSPRDVVDSGDLVDSYNLEVKSGVYGITANYSYDSGHAIFVYLGWTTKLGLEVPPYPWIMQAIDVLDISSIFKEEWCANS